MIISRDAYVDDSRLYGVTLALQTRTREMHSALSDAPDEVRDRVGEVVARALTEIRELLAASLAPVSASPGTSAFGCGT